MDRLKVKVLDVNSDYHGAEGYIDGYTSDYGFNRAMVVVGKRIIAIKLEDLEVVVPEEIRHEMD